MKKFESEWNSLLIRVKKLEYWFNYLNKKVDELEKDLQKFWTLTAGLNKLMPEIEERIDKLEEKIKTPKKEKRKEISKDLVEEIISLNEIVKNLSMENEELRKMMREIRVLQMQAITPDAFVGVVGRVKEVEKKISELEEELSKVSKAISMKKKIEKIEKELKKLAKNKPVVLE